MKNTLLNAGLAALIGHPDVVDAGAAGEVAVDVSRVDRRNCSLYDLDVLLRHRPRSIPQAQESA